VNKNLLLVVGFGDDYDVKMLIALAADEAYAVPLATTLRSVVEANKKHWPLDFYILHDGFRPARQEKVSTSLPEGSALLLWVSVETNLFKDFFTIPHVSKMTYARFLLPRLFPETVSKVLYLDTDLLVFEDLAPLWTTDLEGTVLAAVPDFYYHTKFVLAGLDPRLNRARYAGLPRVEEYFNAGVLLIDLDRWREEGISEKALDYFTDRSTSPNMDQDALNYILANRWKKLDLRWNVQDHIHRSVERAGIVHFVTRLKPWRAATRSYNARLYDSFRSRTRFARTPLEKLQDVLIRFGAGIGNAIRRGGFEKPK
jgi:lipopolysaccharide biosynthesis glycosyltransferase